MGILSRRLVAGLAAAAAAGTVGAGASVLPRVGTTPGVAKATEPGPTTCASRLIRDWADGRIDGTYPIACYRNALRALPTDLEVYSSAPDDIAQALSQRIVQSRGPVRRAAG